MTSAAPRGRPRPAPARIPARRGRGGSGHESSFSGRCSAFRVPFSGRRRRAPRCVPPPATPVAGSPEGAETRARNSSFQCVAADFAGDREIPARSSVAQARLSVAPARPPAPTTARALGRRPDEARPPGRERRPRRPPMRTKIEQKRPGGKILSPRPVPASGSPPAPPEPRAAKVRAADPLTSARRGRPSRIS